MEEKKSLDEIDPELIATFEKLGIPLNEQKRISGVAVDAVFDSVSVGTTHKEDLEKVSSDKVEKLEVVEEEEEQSTETKKNN